jgi:hypothetical protein
MPSIINSKVQAESDLLPTVEYQKVANKHITKAVGRLRDHVFVSGQGLQVVTSVSLSNGINREERRSAISAVGETRDGTEWKLED